MNFLQMAVIACRPHHWKCAVYSGSVLVVDLDSVLMLSEVQASMRRVHR